MKKLKILILLTLLLLCNMQLRAQWDLPFSQFWMAKTYFNPSFAGETEKIQIAGFYKIQWVDIKNAPKRYMIAADSPIEFFGARHGVGLLTYSETIDQMRNSLIAGQYTYKYKIGKSYLNIGIQAGIYDLNFDPTSYKHLPDTAGNGQNSLLVNPTHKKTLDVNAGISWISKNIYIGVGAAHLTQPQYYSVKDTLNQPSQPNEQISGDSINARIPRTYNFMLGCNIRLPGTLFQIRPMIWAQSDLTNTFGQAALQIRYDDKYSLGAAWRYEDGYSFFAGATIQGFEIGYAYDLYTAGIGKSSKGNHEISFRYRFPFDLFKKQLQPHKSIRLL